MWDKTWIIVVIACAAIAIFIYTRTKAQRRRMELMERKMVIEKIRLLNSATEAAARRSAGERRAKIVEKMNRLASIGDPHKSLLELANIYKHGEYGAFRPDNDAAALCARTVLFTSTNVDQRASARAILFSPELDEVDMDRDVPGLPPEFASQAARRARTVVGSTVRISRQKKPVTRVDIPSDSQNAHDHGVSTSTRDTLRGLEEQLEHDVREDVLGYISTSCGVSDDAKAAAVAAVDTLRDSVDSPYIGMSELDALSRVWSAVEDKDTVVLQLASMIEHGMPVCHSGKMARLAGCMDTQRPTVVPLWAIKQEIYEIAARVRDDVLSSESGDMVDLYNSGRNPMLSERMSSEFKRRVDAIESSIDPSILRSIVDDVISSF
jgi:hypothetical protein